MAVRIAHISDVHLTAKPLGWHPRDFLSKRVTGWMNVRLFGRGRRFRFAPRIVAALRREWPTRNLDALVFSGDATSMGFEAEFAAASHALGVDDSTLPPAVAVPGNHDYYTIHATKYRYFEKYFAPWLTGLRLTTDEYPFARQIGPIWLIAANSSTVNRWNWDASGAIGADQLERLRQLCQYLPPGPRVLVTHYPLRTAQGQIEPRIHRLRDHAAALAWAQEAGIDLWLHGHIHRAFILRPTPAIPFAVVCAGSTTQQPRWGYNEYTIESDRLLITRRIYLPEKDCFEDAEFHELIMNLLT
jgi:3',5'-cyclic AMP phosphodiesterase CpdA